MVIGIIIGIFIGIGACIAFNYLKPSKFDELTQEAATKVKEKL